MNFTEVLDQHVVFQVIAQVAQQHRMATYVVGGFVRDLLLKRPFEKTLISSA